MRGTERVEQAKQHIVKTLNELVGLLPETEKQKVIFAQLCFCVSEALME
jgi:thermostable 8-oxoguanine DNA glycosylase